MVLSRRSPSPAVSLVSLVVGGCFLPACGVSDEVGIGTWQAAIEGGEVDESSTSVFRVLTRASGFEALCSATLIAPQLMLTARHCIAKTNSGTINCAVDRFGPAIPISEVKFSNATEPDLYSLWFDAVHILTSDESDLTCGYDIAVVILKEPVPSSVAVPAAPRFTPQILTGEVYTAVGYGASDANEAQAEFGIRHSRAGLAVACGQDRACESFVTSREFVGAGGACHGDSGGPALDAQGQVIGVLSRGADGCSSPVYTGVPAYQSLLLAAAQRAQTTFGVPLPVWAGGEPTPAEEPEGSEPATDAVPGDEDMASDEKPDAGEPRAGAVLREQSGCAVSAASGRSSPSRARLEFAGLFAAALLLVGRGRRRQQFLVEDDV
jgi:Trypsin